MKDQKKLQIAIYRSEKAYLEYRKNNLFFQALRIYNANKIVYEILQEYQLSADLDEQDEICEYIFHLEDWMTQFEYSKINIKIPNEKFVFDRWDGAIPYPKNFINKK